MWATIEHHDSVHVVPINDIKEHSLDNCECGVKYNDGVYIHNSYDKRELLEGLQVETKIHS